MFKTDAHLIVPLSRNDFDQEQDFKVLRYVGKDQFDEVEAIMRTSFARRIDKQQLADSSLDIDYFNNMQRTSKLQHFEERVKQLEHDFRMLQSQKSEGGKIKLAELMQDPEVKATLDELRDCKKKVQGLRYALADSIAEAQKEEQNDDK